MNELISRKESIALKGIAIGIIIVQHIGQAFRVSAVNPLGPIGVFIFLFLSGYGLMCSYNKNGLAHYFSKKMTKVYLPYVVAVVLFVIFQLIIGNAIDAMILPQYLVLTELPQGSYWYLVLMFYWYIVFYFIVKIVENLKLSIPIMLVATITIIVVQGFSRSYIWQFASFPLGLIAGVYPERFKIVFDKLRAWRFAIMLIFVSLVLMLIKKTPYVETHELGVADTILQILITWLLSVVLIVNAHYLIKIRLIDKILTFVGIWSYSLYLAHVLPLDYLKNNLVNNTNWGRSIFVYMTTALICTKILRCVEVILDKVIKTKMVNSF